MSRWDGHLSHEDLTTLYDAVIYAFGAQTDRRLGLPGEDLPGSWSATELGRLVQRPPPISRSSTSTWTSSAQS